jgi:copper chaperone NosL
MPVGKPGSRKLGRPARRKATSRAPDLPTSRLRPSSRVAIALASLALLVLYLAPLWHVGLKAPQYPEGLGMYIWVHQITGEKPQDLNSINGLNHYIGMKPILPESFPELRLMPLAVAAAVAAGLLVALVARRKLLYAWAALFTAGSLVGLADFYRWGYQYGHELDPHAAIKIPGMSYQPPLLGSKQLLNFHATSWPALGGWVALLVLALLLALAVREWRGARARTG